MFIVSLTGIEERRCYRCVGWRHGECFRNRGHDPQKLGGWMYLASKIDLYIWITVRVGKAEVSGIFLADRTIGRAFVTGCRLSVCRLSVTFCILAKRYVLAKKLSEGANRVAPGDYQSVPIRTPIPPLTGVRAHNN